MDIFVGVGTGGPLFKSYSGVITGTEVHYIDAKILSIRWHSNSKDTSVGFVAKVYGLVSITNASVKTMKIHFIKFQVISLTLVFQY